MKLAVDLCSDGEGLDVTWRDRGFVGDRTIEAAMGPETPVHHRGRLGQRRASFEWETT